jgi:hypothetical protein
MKHLKLLVCAMALASLAVFTGCGGDDDDNGGNPAPTGTNALPSLSPSTVTLNPDDGSGAHTIVIDANGGYTATFNDASTETGNASYTASGDTGTLVLTPTTAEGVSTITLNFDASSAAGTYSSDTVGAGTFTVTGTATP